MSKYQSDVSEYHSDISIGGKHEQEKPSHFSRNEKPKNAFISIIPPTEINPVASSTHKYSE